MDTFTHQALHQALDILQQASPEYGAGLSDHRPMALHALAELGCSAQQVQARHRHGLAHHPGDAPRPPGFAERRAALQRALQHEGADAVLRRELPALMDGVGGVAFHGLIRTGHAVQAGHAGELASALAYWGSRPLRLGPVAPGPTLPAPAWWARLEARAAEAEPARAPLISERMNQVAQGDAWRALAPGLDLGADPAAGLASLAAGVAEAYARSGNFTVLHGLTALRAARVLLPWVDDAGALRPLGPALAAAMLSSRYRPQPDMPYGPATPDPWPGLAAAAAGQTDEHVIKLVHAARDWTLWHAAAAPAFVAAAQRALA